MDSRLTALAIALLAATIAGAAALAGATAPAKNGRIAFARVALVDGVETSQIFVTSADGTGEQKLEQGSSSYLDDLPDWSPDGSRIVFQRCAPGGGACLVFSASPDGTGLKRLSAPCPAGQAPPACADDRSPAYSPDGRRIAFIRTKSRPVLMLADASLRHAHPVAGLASSRVAPYAVTWSPNGKRLAFASASDDGRALFVVGANGAGLRRLTPWTLEAGGRPDWSPGGGRILFRSGSNRLGGFGVNLYTVRPDGTGLAQLTRIQASDRVLGGSYSPDGASIVLSTTAGASDPAAPELAVVRADGTGLRPVTRSGSWNASPDWGPRR